MNEPAVTAAALIVSIPPSVSFRVLREVAAAVEHAEFVGIGVGVVGHGLLAAGDRDRGVLEQAGHGRAVLFGGLRIAVVDVDGPGAGRLLTERRDGIEHEVAQASGAISVGQVVNQAHGGAVG